MFENPRRGRQARNITTNVPKILDLKSSSEQIFFRKLSLGAPGWTIPLLLVIAYTRQLEILATALSVTHIQLQPSQLSTCYLAWCKKCLVFSDYNIYNFNKDGILAHHPTHLCSRDVPIEWLRWLISLAKKTLLPAQIPMKTKAWGNFRHAVE